MTLQKVHRSILLSLLAFLPAFLEAKEKDSLQVFHEYKNEVSFDMFNFINLLRPNFVPVPSAQMAFAIEHTISKKTIARLGSEISIRNYTIRTASQPALEHNDAFLLLRLGLEKEKEIHSRWEIFYGFDLLYNYDLKHDEQGDATIGVSINDSKTLAYGTSLLMGLKFAICPRITLSTETAIEVWKFHSTLSSENDLFPSGNSNGRTSGVYTRYGIPENIFLNVKF